MVGAIGVDQTLASPNTVPRFDQGACSFGPTCHRHGATHKWGQIRRPCGGTAATRSRRVAVSMAKYPQFDATWKRLHTLGPRGGGLRAR